MESCDPVGTPMEIKDKLDLDQNGTLVDATKYRSMIGALMYLTSSRPNIVHATCLCAQYQAKPTEKHLKEVKRILRYLRGTVNTGLWYTKDSGAAHRWLEKEPPRSIHTWEDLVSKFINEFFPPSRTTNLRNEISNFNNDTFYNALNPADQDSLNAAAGGNLLERRTQDELKIIENKSKVRNSQNKSVVSQVKSYDANSNSSSEIAELTHAVNQSGSFPSNTVANPKGELKAITTRSGLVLDGCTLHIDITLVDALILMLKYQKILKALMSNKEKLQELENTPLNENCSAVILKKLPEKLGDPGKFLIPCGFTRAGGIYPGTLPIDRVEVL
nr:copia protein [Tanacetum cinerariifolium]